MMVPARRLGALVCCIVACSFATAGFAATAAAAAVGYDISVRIDPASRELSAAATIIVQPGAAAEIALAQRFAVERLLVDGAPAAAPRAQHGLSIWRLGAASTPRKIEMRWRGRLDTLDATLDHRQTLDAASPVSGAEGTFLPAAAAWYPTMRGLMPSYRVAIDLPQGQRGLVPGRLVEETEANGRTLARFEFLHPAEGIDLMAGPYRVETRAIKSVSGKPISLRTYFHPQIAALSAGYLDAVAGYIELYENRIGAYPYSEFSVVSSPTPTGFGMPTLTYLGIDVLRLPFIRATSLGHEVLHNWWGNGVYPDYARGNWSEGLTTFMADYAYKERESDAAAREMRLEWLRDFAAVPAGQDRPLVEFTSRTHGTSQIVGYNKAAMTFLMLRDLIGGEAFDAGIRRFWRDYRFKTASWDALQKSFEAEAKRDLSAFFAQWLTRQGAPSLQMESAVAAADQVRVTLAQQTPAYQLRVPLALRRDQRDDLRYAEIAGESATVAFKVDAHPAEIALDPDFRLFRRLAPEEAPPILRQVMIDPSTVTVLPGGPAAVQETAKLLATKLQDAPPRFGAGDERADGAPLLLIGLGDEVDRWLQSRALPARPEQLRQGSAAAWTAAIGRGKSIAVVSARDAESLAALVRPLPHYGRRSYVVFEGAKVIESGVWPARPQTLKLAGTPARQTPAASAPEQRTPGSVFKDCAECPEMVVIPAGRFTMGAAPGEEEREALSEPFRHRSQPQHAVTVPGFAAGKFEITRGQYRLFAENTGRGSDGCFVWRGERFEKEPGKDWRNPGYAQDDSHPVTCVSWDDAGAYAEWLGRKTGKAYRLLSEAEWEYAARAGTTTTRFWGEAGDASCAHANGADAATAAQVPGAGNWPRANCDDGHAFTAPVGSYRANAFGLHDMAGNVWEWTQDCWNANYRGAPADGSAWVAGDCSQRAVRGGSWEDAPVGLRAAYRVGSPAVIRVYIRGFRVARSDY